MLGRVFAHFGDDPLLDVSMQGAAEFSERARWRGNDQHRHTAAHRPNTHMMHLDLCLARNLTGLQ